MAKIDAFFHMLLDKGGSDLHIVAGAQPMLRVSGDILRVDYPVMDGDNLRKMLYEITPDDKIKKFEETGDLDFSYEIPGKGRFRCNFFNQTRGIGAIFRVIPTKILTARQLGLPETILKFTNLTTGLVLVTGPTGSGKSTTLAAMIDYINRTRREHILTIEDPVEFVHHPMRCSVNHREIGTHTSSFAAALRAALREDPDVILVGEMRDLETIALALEAASTGHLVFGTLHTNSAPKTIERIIGVFPAEEQAKIRVTLSETLRGVVAQALLKKVGGGRVAALEILFVNNAVGNLIREAKTFQIISIMQTQKKLGMRTLDDSLTELLSKKIISPEAAYEHAINKDLFVKFLKTPPDELFG